MVASTTPAFAPGYRVVTETWGGTISGYCAIGMVKSASAPAIVVTTAMTMARRGRSTKIAESMDSTSPNDRRYRGGPHWRTGPDALEPLDDDQFAPRQSASDNDVRATCTCRLHPFDGSLAVLDDEHVSAFLIGDQGSLGDENLFLRRPAFKYDLCKLTIDQHAVRVGHGGAYRHRVGGFVHGDVDEIDRAHLVVGRAIGKADADILDVRPAAG